ncbi:MAG TPA: type VI secretion system-associated protein TagF [Albitalea sp.]|jgi:type VI secretion system protein ImpM|nr:type VI secretion system-associated protein TagF [Albitalea sp.]
MSEAAVKPLALPGWFGKLPALGDFAQRRLPEVFVRRWDRWLQRSLDSARAELGDGWLDAYLVAPMRRFWLAPGVVGARGWAGLMMPSVDRVGRHFPLTIARPLEPLGAALAAQAWFRALDAAARQVLDVEFSVDDLEQALANVAMDLDPMPDEAADRLAQRLLGRCAAGTPCSVWWCDGALLDDEFLCFAPLPPADAFASLIEGPP